MKRIARAVALASLSVFILSATGMVTLGLLGSPDSSLSNGGLLELEPREATVDWKHTSEGEPTEFEFTLRNVGTQPLQIHKITTSCGCTVAKALETDVLPPGASTPLKVEVQLPDLGEKLARIEVYTNSGTRAFERATLRLIGREEAPYFATVPNELPLRGSTTEIFEREFVVRTVEFKETDYWLRLVEPNSPDLRIDALEVSQEEGPTRKTVTRVYRYRLTARALAEKSFYRLTLRTSESEPMPQTIGVTTEIVPAISTAPSTVFVTVSAKELPRKLMLRVISKDPEFPLQIEVEESIDPWLQIGRIEYLEDPFPFVAQLPLTVTALPQDIPEGGPNKSKTALTKTSIHLTTNHPDCATLEVPVYIQTRR